MRGQGRSSQVLPQPATLPKSLVGMGTGGQRGRGLPPPDGAKRAYSPQSSPKARSTQAPLQIVAHESLAQLPSPKAQVVARKPPTPQVAGHETLAQLLSPKATGMAKKPPTPQVAAHESSMQLPSPKAQSLVMVRKPPSPAAPQGPVGDRAPPLFRRTSSSSMSLGAAGQHPGDARATERIRSVPSTNGNSGLFSRRLGRRSAGGSASKTGSLRVDTALQEEKRVRRTIQRCENFAELYKLGGEVMPSVHRDMEVRWAVPRTGSDREVVIKVRYKKGSFHSQSDESAWRASTEMVLNLPSSAGIARIHEVLEDPTAYYVVMEKVGGMDLFETLHAEGKLPVDEVKEVLRQLLDAVGELHENGCIHKDLKLENVMLERRASVTTSLVPQRSPTTGSAPSSAGHSGGGAASSGLSRRASAPNLGMQALSTTAVKLIDFDTVEEWSPKSPKAADVLGTDQYIAPEAYEGRYSPASDMFAVGVIGYRLLTGSFPFRGAIFDDQPGENWVGSPKMKEIKERLNAERIDWRHPVFNSERGLQHILARMLSVKETLRPSAREVLADPCLALPRAPPAGHRERPPG